MRGALNVVIRFSLKTLKLCPRATAASGVGRARPLLAFLYSQRVLYGRQMPSARAAVKSVAISFAIWSTGANWFWRQSFGPCYVFGLAERVYCFTEGFAARVEAERPWDQLSDQFPIVVEVGSVRTRNLT